MGGGRGGQAGHEPQVLPKWMHQNGDRGALHPKIPHSVPLCVLHLLCIGSGSGYSSSQKLATARGGVTFFCCPKSVFKWLLNTATEKMVAPSLPTIVSLQSLLLYHALPPSTAQNWPVTPLLCQCSVDLPFISLCASISHL